MDNKKVLSIIFITVLIDMLGVGILIPIFPILATTPQYNISYITLSWLLATFSIAQFIFTPILGQLADNYGRKKLLAISIIGTSISYLLFTIAIYIKNIPLMFIARALDGVTGGNIAIAQTVIGDISDPQDRAKNFGLIGVAFGIGFIFGPVVGAMLSNHNIIPWFNIYTPFLFASILSAINTFLVLIFLKETGIIKNNPIILSKSLTNLKKAFITKQLAIVFSSIFLFNCGFTFFTSFWGVILRVSYNFTQTEIGNFFAYTGLWLIIAQGVVVRKLSKSAIDYKILKISLLGTSLTLIAFYCLTIKSEVNYLWIYFINAFFAVFVAITRSFSNSLVSRISPELIRGETMGINTSTFALAQAITSILSGYLASYHAPMTILVGSICALISWLLFILKYSE